MRSMVEEILKALKNANLLTEGTLVMIKGGFGKEVFNFVGEKVESNLFARIAAPFALFTSGKYSSEYCKMGRAAHAANDDAAMMFGSKVKCLKGKAPKTSCLLFNEGFLVVGRFPGELVAAAILLEKMCKAEILSKKIGKIRRLPAFLCAIERLAYLKIYSKKEKENYDQGRRVAEADN